MELFLPLECWINVSTHLSLEDIVNNRVVNKLFYQLYQDYVRNVEPKCTVINTRVHPLPYQYKFSVSPFCGIGYSMTDWTVDDYTCSVWIKNRRVLKNLYTVIIQRNHRKRFYLDEKTKRLRRFRLIVTKTPWKINIFGGVNYDVISINIRHYGIEDSFVLKVKFDSFTNPTNSLFLSRMNVNFESVQYIRINKY